MLKKLRSILNAADTRRYETLYLRLLREVRSLNRTARRQATTIRRLRAKIELDAPTTLPPLAQSPEGRALYNHAYQMGRRKGRKDVLEAIDAEGETLPPITDDKAFDVDAVGLSTTPPKAALEAVERVKDEKYVDTSVAGASNDEVSLGAAPPKLVVVSNGDGQDRESYTDTQDRKSYSTESSDDTRPGS